MRYGKRIKQDENEKRRLYEIPLSVRWTLLVIRSQTATQGFKMIILVLIKGLVLKLDIKCLLK